MTDIERHYDHGPAVEPPDSGMRIVAFAVAWAVLVLALACLPAVFELVWR